MAQATHSIKAPRTSTGLRTAIVAALIGAVLVAGFARPGGGESVTPDATNMSTAAQQAWADRYNGLAEAYATSANPFPRMTDIMSAAAQQAWTDRMDGIAANLPPTITTPAVDT